MGSARERGIEPQGRTALCYVGVPLAAGDSVIGVIGIQDYEREDTYDSGHLDILIAIASQAAIALENARLFAETQRLARTDALTGIANRRQLFEVGSQELSRARRFDHPLSALMMDIDHFKEVNDEHGHAVGDIVLQDVARICKSYVRDIDIIARSGGEEFTILLVETERAGAQHLRLTVSVGVAGARPDSDGLAALLARADGALYAAKVGGRNRVESV